MPVSYRYDSKTNVVLTRPTGVLTISDVRSYFSDVFRDPEIAPGFVEIVLFDDVKDFAFRYTESAVIMEAYSRFMLSRRCARTVFLARSPLGYGIARMLGSAFEGHGDLRVVRSEDELIDELSDIRSQNISLDI